MCVCYSTTVLSLLLQRTVRVLSGVEEVAVFSQKSRSDIGAPPAEVRGQLSSMTKLGIKLTIRYNVKGTLKLCVSIDG